MSSVYHSHAVFPIFRMHFPQCKYSTSFLMILFNDQQVTAMYNASKILHLLLIINRSQLDIAELIEIILKVQVIIFIIVITKRHFSSKICISSYRIKIHIRLAAKSTHNFPRRYLFLILHNTIHLLFHNHNRPMSHSSPHPPVFQTYLFPHCPGAVSTPHFTSHFHRCLFDHHGRTQSSHARFGNEKEGIVVTIGDAVRVGG
mmetsp:Transcript_6612/g.14398  ORF Transcript_6612/g.14398 Transcript_6612/m.14398 type:complete len:202 (-) Transcript_6612:890-1495(-)